MKDDAKNLRILLIDDNPSIHEDFAKILTPGRERSSVESSSRVAFLGEAAEQPLQVEDFQPVSAFQGEQGVQLAREARERGEPFALAFVDVRMPPGLDGVQTIKRLWAEDENLHAVICTAYADYSFEDIVAELGSSDRLLILKKPFDPVEVRQIAGSLTEKWASAQRVQLQLSDLQSAEREAREHAASMEVAMRALEEANERYEAANRAKSAFLANMSHEIRTPMNAILGYADFLCDPAISFRDRQEYGRIIRQSGKHLLSILNDILDLSKIEAGRVKITSSSFNPQELGREVVSLMRERAQAKGLELQIAVAASTPQQLNSDPVRVRQILLNLIGNSLKFTERGTIRLELCGEEDPAGGLPRMRFDIVDTGIGVEPAALATIFEAFNQADTSTTRRAGGTGLGLAISRRLADMLGGALLVESEPGRGSTFSLVLETGVTTVPDQAPEQQPVRPSVEDGTPWSARVLLVEDVPLNRALITTILKRVGAEIVEAENGQTGVEAFGAAQEAGRPFDLVLMDMQMPVMDGYEATRRLRAQGWPGPVIALTAHAMSGDKQKCQEAGCTDYLTKPVDRERLVQMCRSLAPGSQPGPALPAKPTRESEEPSRELPREG